MRIVLLTGCLALAACGWTGMPAPTSSVTATLATPTTTATPFELTVGKPLARVPARRDTSFSGATFVILQVEAGTNVTQVTWAALHPRTIRAGDDYSPFAWQSFPTIYAGGRAYSPLTYLVGKRERCVCSDVGWMRPDPIPTSALYPPLPAGVTKVVIGSKWFDPVEVPVFPTCWTNAIGPGGSRLITQVRMQLVLDITRAGQHNDRLTRGVRHLDLHLDSAAIDALDTRLDVGEVAGCDGQAGACRCRPALRCAGLGGEVRSHGDLDPIPLRVVAVGRDAAVVA